MTGNNILLDTNIVIEVFDGNENYAEKISEEKILYLPSIVLGELYTGINRVTNKNKHLKKLIDFLTICEVVNVDANTSRIYGKIVAELYKKGKPIPTNDIWIAALTQQHGFTLISNDNHFDEIENLNFNKWK